METAALGASRSSTSTRDTSAPDVLPASQYLQERLQERRAKNTRPKRGRQSDFGPRRGRDDDIFVDEAEAEAKRRASGRTFDSSPVVSSAPRSNADVAEGSGRRRGLGAKGMDEHMDRLTKENFALKLELDHRREHTAKLQEQIEAMRAQVERTEQLQEEHAELLRINSQLVEELEKRDKAVEEAMDIICDLEDRVADIEEDRDSTTRPSTANADSGYAGTETHEHAPPSSPPETGKAPKTPTAALDPPPAAASAATNRLLSAVNGKTPARPRREPLVLSQKKQSTHALRSVYLETTQSLHPVKSFNSLLTRQESRNGDEDELPNSPRLSVLSESSFPSLYSPKKGLSPDRYAWEGEDDETVPPTAGPSPHLRQDSIKRVSQWMDERDLTEETPSKSNSISPPLVQPLETVKPTVPLKRPEHEGAYQSLGDALSLNPRSVNQDGLELREPVQYVKPFPIRTGRNLNKISRPTSFGGAMFGEPLLPPTPESASTRMLRASRSSIVDEKSLLDTTPAAVKGFDALEPGIRTAPRQMRSSVELNNAYESYVQHRDQRYLDKSPLHNVDDDDATSDTVRDLSLDYDGFPDGGSILMGTPSRFLKHGKPSIPNRPSDGYDISPVQTRQPPFARRQSSSEATISPRKPNFSRAETSPPTQYGRHKIVTTNLQSSSGSVTSPRSYNSGSSSNRTIVQTEGGDRNISPELYRIESQSTTNVTSPTRSRTSPSPARRLSQKAQGLLRRMSGSHRDVGFDREKSPLPTLTATPSSAYVNTIPKEARRPGTSYSGGDLVGSYPPPTARTLDSGSRPSMQTRTNTAPGGGSAPPLSGNVSERASLDAERKNLFRRSNSSKPALDMPVTNGNTSAAVAPDGSGGLMRGIITNRRGSFKDAVASATRRTWR